MGLAFGDIILAGIHPGGTEHQYELGVCCVCLSPYKVIRIQTWGLNPVPNVV